MLFNSIEFVLFFIIVLCIFYCIPQKIRYIWLLLASYFFYMNWSVKYTLLLLFSTLITYICGLILDAINNRIQKVIWKKMTLFACIILNLGILFYFKYLDFTIYNIELFFATLGFEYEIPHSIPLLPVGISFYIFQSLSYTIDVYRNQIEPEKNFFKYALFVSFFPQLVAGPIERSQNLITQINQKKIFDKKNLIDGFYLVLWGYFLKIIIADRISTVVDNVYNSPKEYSGTILLVASILFAFQIYCDFAGYSTIAMGTAKMMGFSLMENFNAPYLAESINDFWKRWHISLTSWFRDYLYIPLGGNKKGNIRKFINLITVFLVSGLWHGASWTFIIWGGLNGLFRVAENITEKLRKRVNQILGFEKNSIGNGIFRILFTFSLIDLTWVFFRANGLSEALYIIRKILTDFTPWIFTDNTLYTLGLDEKNFAIMILGIEILLAVDILKRKGIIVREIIQKQNFLFRCLCLTIFICFILIFGIWGPNYDATGFIYFQF